MSLPGASLFFLLFLVRLAQVARLGLSAIGLLLALQAGLVALLLFVRRRAERAASLPVQFAAWASAVLPMLVQTPQVAHPFSWPELLPLPGLALNLWALTCLGTAFGISPANRGLVLSGPYRWVRHPMYLGELLSLGGTLAVSPALVNLTIFLVFAGSITWRIHQEEKVLGCNGYSFYTARVRWRLLPFVW